MILGDKPYTKLPSVYSGIVRLIKPTLIHKRKELMLRFTLMIGRERFSISLQGPLSGDYLAPMVESGDDRMNSALSLS